MQKEEILKLADINPEMEAWLNSNSKPETILELPVMRDQMTLMEHVMINANPSLAEGVVIENTTIEARDGYPIPVRTYKPETASGNLCPLIVAIHGGGWSTGSPNFEEVHCRQFVKELGAACVNIDYRLAPEHKFPHAVHDCWDVIQYLSKNASSMLPADPKEGFVVTGSSAGGNLSDVMGHLSRDNNLSPPITGLLEVAPFICHPDHIPEQYKDMHLSWEQNEAPPLGMSAKSATWQMDFYQADKTSPLYSSLLDPKKHVGMPPVFIQAHGMDPLRDQSLIYHEALKEAGVKSVLKMYPGTPHNFNAIFIGFETTLKHEKELLEGMAWLLGGAK